MVAGTPDCLTQPPPEPIGAQLDALRAIASLAPGATGTRDQVDALAAAYVDAITYGRRAYSICGTKR